MHRFNLSLPRSCLASIKKLSPVSIFHQHIISSNDIKVPTRSHSFSSWRAAISSASWRPSQNFSTLSRLSAASKRQQPLLQVHHHRHQIVIVITVHHHRHHNCHRHSPQLITTSNVKISLLQKFPELQQCLLSTNPPLTPQVTIIS